MSSFAMVSSESTVMMPNSTAGSPDEYDAALQAKVNMMRGSTGPSVLSKRLSRKVTLETEGTSTTDTDGTDEESRRESDGLSDASLEGRDVVPALDFDNIPASGVDASPCLMTADPFDAMTSMRVRPAFSEREMPAGQNEMYSTQGVAPMQPPAMPQMEPMPAPSMQQVPMQQMPMQQMPMQQMPMQQMAMQQMAMQQMQQMAPPAAPQVATGAYPTNRSQGSIQMVPVPVPVPFQMPFSMPKGAPQSVAVPPGFKLVRIPEPAQEKKAAPAQSPISDPANTERKIFVGGLNPITTGQALREYFSSFGPVMDAKVIREGEKSKGFGFVQFKDSIPTEVLEQVHIIDQRRCGVGPAFHRENAH